jgi:hypothetical protein
MNKNTTTPMQIQNTIQALIIAAIVTCTSGICHADENTDRATDAAKSWLEFIDTKEYKKSWTEAAPFFKEKVSEKDWEKMASSVCEPLGKVKSRQLIAAQFTKTLLGAPEGEYVVIQFKTNFENKPDSVETITPMKTDGVWRVSGYFIK